MEGRGLRKHSRGTERDLKRAKEGRRRRHSLTQNGGADAEADAPGGAPHAPRDSRPGAGGWTRAPGPAGRRGPVDGGARKAARVAALGGEGPELAGRWARGRTRQRRPQPAAPAGNGPHTHLRRTPGVRERRRSRGNEWSGDCSLATPGRAARSCQGGCDRCPSPRTPGSWSAGRPQPTVPSAGVTHSRRSASSRCSRAAPTANPPARPPARAAPPRRRGRRPASLRVWLWGRCGLGQPRGAPHGPRLAAGVPSLLPGCRHMVERDSPAQGNVSVLKSDLGLDTKIGAGKLRGLRR